MARKFAKVDLSDIPLLPLFLQKNHRKKRQREKLKDKQIFGGLDLSDVPEQPLVPSDTTSSHYKGVKQNKTRWEARISSGGKRIHLGTFDSPEEAAGVFSRAAYYLKNQPPEPETLPPIEKEKKKKTPAKKKTAATATPAKKKEKTPVSKRKSPVKKSKVRSSSSKKSKVQQNNKGKPRNKKVNNPTAASKVSDVEVAEAEIIHFNSPSNEMPQHALLDQKADDDTVSLESPQQSYSGPPSPILEHFTQPRPEKYAYL